MDNLVKKLSDKKSNVVLDPKTEKLSELLDRIRQGFVFIQFTDTNGCTELGIELDQKSCIWDGGNYTTGELLAHLEGNCELNFHSVRCVVDIDLSSRKGDGILLLVNKKL